MSHQSQFALNLHVPKSKKAHVVISLTLRRFAFGLMGMFVPIYLLTIGLSLVEVVLFNIATSILRMAFLWPVTINIQKNGAHHTLAYSYITMSLFILSLYLAQFSSVGIILALFLVPLTSAAYWAARWDDLATIFGKKHMTEQMGNISILAILASVAAPIIGGMVADTAGPEYALLLTFAVLLLAITVIRRELKSEKPSSSKPKLDISFSSMIRDAVANIGSIFQGEVAVYMWPLFIYLTLSTFTSVGIIIGIGTIASIGLIKVVSRFDDRGVYPVFNIGVLLKMVVHGLRALVITFNGFLATNIASDTANSFLEAPYVSRYMKHAKEAGVTSYVFYFEMLGTIGAVVAWSLLLVFLLAFDQTSAFQLMFLVAVPFTALMALINKPIKH